MRYRIALVLVAIGLIAGCARPSDPLGLEDGFGGEVRGPFTGGDTVVVEWAVLRAPTDVTVTLLGVRPRLGHGDRPGTPTLRSAYLLDRSQVEEIWAINTAERVRYPAALRHPVAGLTVEPGTDWSLIVELDIRTAGRWAYDGLVVDYVYGGRVYSPVVDVNFVICADQPEGCVEATVAAP